MKVGIPSSRFIRSFLKNTKNAIPDHPKNPTKKSDKKKIIGKDAYKEIAIRWRNIIRIDSIIRSGIQEISGPFPKIGRGRQPGIIPIVKVKDIAAV
jgi:hypothetical protein